MNSNALIQRPPRALPGHCCILYKSFRGAQGAPLDALSGLIRKSRIARAAGNSQTDPSQHSGLAGPAAGQIRREPRRRKNAGATAHARNPAGTTPPARSLPPAPGTLAPSRTPGNPRCGVFSSSPRNSTGGRARALQSTSHDSYPCCQRQAHRSTSMCLPMGTMQRRVRAVSVSRSAFAK